MEFDKDGKVVINKRRVVKKSSKDDIPAISIVTKPRPKKKWKFSSDGKFRWEIDAEEEEQE